MESITKAHSKVYEAPYSSPRTHRVQLAKSIVEELRFERQGAMAFDVAITTSEITHYTDKAEFKLNVRLVEIARSKGEVIEDIISIAHNSYDLNTKEIVRLIRNHYRKGEKERLSYFMR